MLARSATHLKQPVCFASSSFKYLNKDEPYDEFKTRFLSNFNEPEIDGWWLRKSLQDLHTEDIIPEPEIICSILKACRRINDLALAIRYIESLKVCILTFDLF